MRRFFLFLSLLSTLVMGFAFGQTVPYPEKMPLDPKVRVGKLDNGLTYYIRHNENPKDRADFYIANNVGAMQEDDNQNGLAHFLEHLAFNGLEHFPDKEMLNFLAANGVKFGANVNAYTSRVRTVYNISNVPLYRESFVDSVLLVLHDWSYYISCENDQIEAERGVIREEWRRGDDPRSRMQDKQDSLAYLGSKYSKRTVIGDFDIINNFERQTLIDFYHKWYRPDLQAVIIVGDIDVEEMEAKVKSLLSTLPKVENGAQKEVYDIPYLTAPLIGVTTDSEISYVTTKLLLKQPYPARSELDRSETYKARYIKNILIEMFSARLAKVKEEESSPFRSAVAVNGQLSQCRYTTLITTTPKDEKKLLDNLEAILLEIKRAEKYGFNQNEFEAAKVNIYKKSGLKIDVDADDVTNGKLVSSYVDHFTGGIPYMDPFEQQKICREVFNSITLKDVNNLIPECFSKSEKIVIFSMNDTKKEIAPSQEEALGIFAKVDTMEVKPFSTDEKDASGLKVDALHGSRIVKTKPLKKFNSQEWTLANGIKVVWTPVKTSQKKIDMIMTGRREIGYGMHDDVKALKATKEYVRRMGVRDYSADDVRKALKNTDLRTNVNIKAKYTEVGGSSSVGDFEQMLSMLYLYLTEPNFSKKEYDKFVRDQIELLKRGESEKVKANDTADIILQNHHPWAETVDIDTYNRVDLNMAKSIYMQHFADMKDYVFFLSGTMSEEEVKPLVEKYIGSLPTSAAKVKYPKSDYRYVQKDIDFRVEGKEKEIPKSDVTCIYHGAVRYTAENNMIFKYLRYVLSMRYLASIREEKGGTYHIGVTSDLFSDNGGWYDVTVDFETNPKMTDVLIEEVDKGLANLAETGPSEQEMDETLKYLLKANAEVKEINEKMVSYTHNKVMNLYIDGEDLRTDDEELIKSVSAKQVQKAAKTLLKNHEFIFVFSEKYKPNK